MYVARVPNRNSPPAILLRESYRVGDQVKTRTLANLSHWPEAKIQAPQPGPQGDELIAAAAERFEIERSLPHGHVAAVLGMARKLGLDRLLPQRPRRLAKLLLAMIVARVDRTGRQAGHRPTTQRSDGGAFAGCGARTRQQVDEDELYRALDLLLAWPNGIETALARRHLKDGCWCSTI